MACRWPCSPLHSVGFNLKLFAEAEPLSFSSRRSFWSLSVTIPPMTAFPVSSLTARRHSRVRPKVTVLNYASLMTTVGRPLNEMVLSPLTEQEGEAYLEKCGSVRRHTVANAHSDIQLLAMATMMHSGLGEEAGSEDKHLLLPPSFPPPHRQCSSEPNILDSPDELELEDVASGSQEDSELNCASLS